MKLKKWEVALFIAVIITVVWGVNTQNQQRQLADKLIRFHVVADSDDDEAQRIKLEVRNAVLDEVEQLLENATNRDEAEMIIGENLEAIRKAAENELEAQNDESSIEVLLTKESFPTRYYDTFTLPAGDYTSLRITIGEGEGHNWWCVVFPPLCTGAALDEAEAANFTEAEFKLITENDTGTVIKFKALEIIAEIKEWFALDK